jgi:hypothetical protein
VPDLLSPAIALGFVLSSAFAALFNLWQGGSMQALLRFLLAAWLGFAAGHVLGEIAGIQWLVVGQLNIVSGTAGSAATMLIAKSLDA